MFNKIFYEEDKIQITSYLEVPSHYVTRDGRVIRTCKLRDKKFANLRNGIVESPYEEQFYLSCPHFDREVIIFIEDRERLEFLLRSLGITDKEAYNKNYISMDFFDPQVSLNIEIDSIQHHQNRNLDFVRDQYLFQVFGIRTIRIYGVLLNDNYWRIEDYYRRNDLKPINPELFKFNETSGRFFKKKYESEFNLLELIIKLPIYHRNFLRRGIIVTQKDIKELGISEKSMEKLKIFLEKYYLQPLSIIKNSNQYTAKEAFIVLSQNCPLNDKDKWGQELLNVFEGKEAAGKYGTDKFIEELKRYGYTWETIVNSIA